MDSLHVTFAGYIGDPVRSIKPRGSYTVNVYDKKNERTVVSKRRRIEEGYYSFNLGDEDILTRDGQIEVGVKVYMDVVLSGVMGTKTKELTNDGCDTIINNMEM